MSDADLDRFVDAQAKVHDQVEKELSDGHKRTHWMWFIFPQLLGLGSSPMAERYAIRNIDEARCYLRHPVLGNRLRDDVRLVLSHAGNSSLGIFGTPDDLKFRSCLTLFREAAEDQNDRSLFSEALDQFYGGKPDLRTIQLLRFG